MHRNAPRTPQKAAEAVELRKRGYSYEQIADRVGSSKSSVQRWCVSAEDRGVLGRWHGSSKGRPRKPRPMGTSHAAAGRSTPFAVARAASHAAVPAEDDGDGLLAELFHGSLETFENEIRDAIADDAEGVRETLHGATIKLCAAIDAVTELAGEWDEEHSWTEHAPEANVGSLRELVVTDLFTAIRPARDELLADIKAGGGKAPAELAAKTPADELRLRAAERAQRAAGREVDREGANP